MHSTPKLLTLEQARALFSGVEPPSERWLAKEAKRLRCGRRIGKIFYIYADAVDHLIRGIEWPASERPPEPTAKRAQLQCAAGGGEDHQRREAGGGDTFALEIRGQRTAHGGLRTQKCLQSAVGERVPDLEGHRPRCYERWRTVGFPAAGVRGREPPVRINSARPGGRPAWSCPARPRPRPRPPARGGPCPRTASGDSRPRWASSPARGSRDRR